VNLSATTDGAIHRVKIADIAKLLATHDEPLALFLAHPTRRLSDLLLGAVTQAEQALRWLKEHPLEPPFTVPADSGYAAISEPLRRGISDWRLSIELERVYRDLEEQPVEVMH